MRILFLSAYVPSRIRVRPYSFLTTLAAQGHEVTLVCGAGKDDAAALDALRPYCARVVAVPMSAASIAGSVARGALAGLPLQAALNNTAALRAAVAHEATHGNHDVVHIEHLRASAVGSATGDLPTVLDAVDSISLLFERTLRNGPSLKSKLLAMLDLARTRGYEGQYTRQFNRVLATSPEDAWALETLSPAGALTQVQVVPNGVDLAYFSPDGSHPRPATLVFSGKMSYHANTAAALFLLNDIMPLVWRERPDVQVQLVGSAPPRSIQQAASDPRVQVTGFVTDMRPYITGATLAVAPLRYAVGIQNKVLEAMALGTPMLATRQTARALQAEDGVALADDAADFAAKILHLLGDGAAREQMRTAGRAYVEQHHDWQRLTDQLVGVYQDAIDTPASPKQLPQSSTLQGSSRSA